MMKKFLAIVLALACTLALFACGSYSKDAEAFVEAVKATDPAELLVTVTLETAEGTYTSEYKTVYNEDSTSTMTYKIATVPGLDSAEDIAYVEGTVTCDKDGNYSDGGEVSGKLAATGVKVDLESKKIKEYTVKGNVLTIEVPQDRAEAIIGMELASDAVLSVTKNADGKIVSITLNYTAAEGTVAIVCEYN